MRSWKTVFIILLAFKVLIVIHLYVLFRKTLVSRQYPHHVMVPSGSDRARELRRAQEDIFHRLAPADGQFYREIAEQGYDFHEGRASPFFPMFPLVLAAAAFLTGAQPVVCGAILNFAFCFVALLFLAQLLARMKRPVLPPLILILVFPFAGFYNLLLTESLFLFLSAGSILFVMERRFWWAALFGFLVGLTRPQGVLLAIPLAVEAVSQMRMEAVPAKRQHAWHMVGLSLTPILGVASFFIYADFNTGSLFSVVEAQKGWGRTMGWEALRQIFGPARFPTDLLATIFGIVLLPFIFRSLPTSLAAYGTALAIFPLATGSLLSYSRFIATSFPHFFCLSTILEKRPILWFATASSFLLIQILMNRALMAWVFFG